MVSYIVMVLEVTKVDPLPMLNRPPFVVGVVTRSHSGIDLPRCAVASVLVVDPNCGDT